jgi:hypothetical protein
MIMAADSASSFYFYQTCKEILVFKTDVTCFADRSVVAHLMCNNLMIIEISPGASIKARQKTANIHSKIIVMRSLSILFLSLFIIGQVSCGAPSIGTDPCNTLKQKAKLAMDQYTKNRTPANEQKAEAANAALLQCVDRASGTPRQGAGMSRQGSGLPRQGSGKSRQGSGLPRQGSGKSRQGSALPRQGSGASRGRRI